MKPTVIITGGTKGLGRELAFAFGRSGYCVIALYSADENAAGTLRDLMASEGIIGTVLRHDVRVDDKSLWVRPEILNAPSLCLINNACASFSPVALHQLAWSDFENSFLVAVKGAWSCSQPMIRQMLKNGGCCIVNVLSSALEGNAPKGFSAYLTAKYALLGFTLALAAEYAPRGVKIFSVSPGYMDTPLTGGWDDRSRDLIRSNSTRITVPTQAAHRILELVRDPATPGNGENYPL